MSPARTRSVLAAAAVCVLLALALGGRELSEPGLYYDEAIQAVPAQAFVHDGGEPPRIPGARAVRVAGGWLPWMTQPYMGALKSQALIPVFALATPSVELLRATTLLWALCGVPFAMLFANRLLGAAAAVITGLLLATDPSLLFLGRHDWGSFSLGFALRCGALFAVLSGFRDGSLARIAAGGVCVGLGLYNKIDFAVAVAGCATAFAVAAPSDARALLRTRTRELGALAAGAGVGALPLLLAAGGALSVAGAASRGSALWAELPTKLPVLRLVLDGSYFLRLVEHGGRFEDLPSAASAGVGAAIVVAAWVVVFARWGLARSRGEAAPDRRSLGFLALAAAFTLLALAATPRALRAHHMLNLYPLPQLLVAAAALELVALRQKIPRIAGRVAAGVGVGAALVSSVRVDLATLERLRETGGRGRWSHAVEQLARSLPEDVRVVSLDWGFDGPIRFVAPGTRSEEPIWRLRRGGAGARLAGGPESLYLVHEPEWAVMPYGEALLAALRSLPEDAVTVTRHRDREGTPVLRSLRFTRPHELVYREGRFGVRLR